MPFLCCLNVQEISGFTQALEFIDGYEAGSMFVRRSRPAQKTVVALVLVATILSPIARLVGVGNRPIDSSYEVVKYLTA